MNTADPVTQESFWDHLEELRKRIIRSLLVAAGFATILFFIKETLFDSILFAPAKTDFVLYRWLCFIGNEFEIKDLCVSSISINLMNTEIAGQFRWHIVASFVGGLIVGFPYFVWQIWRFVSPALSNNEKQKIYGVTFFVSLLFLFGLLFGYFFILPLSISFLANYQISSMVENHITLTSYLSTVVFLPLSMGLVFELPLLCFFLSKVGVLSARIMRKYRKHAFVIILVLAGIITPSTDVVTQLLVAVPLFILYEASILISVRYSS